MTHRTTGIALALCAMAALLVWALPATAAKSKKAVAKPAIVNVTAGKPSEFGFKLSKKSVPAGKITFKLTNAGNLPHDFKLCTAVSSKLANACAGKVTKVISPGGKATITVTAKAGKHEYLCTVSGHAAAGMKGILTVAKAM